MKFTIEPVKQFDEKGTPREGWRLLLTAKGIKTDSIFQSLSSLAKHLTSQAELFEDVRRSEQKTELGRKTPMVTRGSLRFKEP